MHYSQKSINNQTLFYAWFPAMFTRIDLLLLKDDLNENLVLIAESIKTEIERLELMANRFNENSEISKINRCAFEKPVPISTEMFQIIEECLMYNTKTLGYFDITIISTNSFTKGISNITLDKTGNSIRFLHPDVKLDVSGFIKGYVLRAVQRILIDENIENALINIGNSSVLAKGNHPQGNGWKVSITNLNKPSECELYNQCLTSSGNTKNTKWPIQQPKTRKKITTNQMLSVITDDPAIGEVLSTALYIANKKEKQIILHQLNGKIINLN